MSYTFTLDISFINMYNVKTDINKQPIALANILTEQNHQCMNQTDQTIPGVDHSILTLYDKNNINNLYSQIDTWHKTAGI